MWIICHGELHFLTFFQISIVFLGLVPSAVLVVTKKWAQYDLLCEPTSPRPLHQHKKQTGMEPTA